MITTARQAYDAWFRRSIQAEHGKFEWTTNDAGEEVDIVLTDTTDHYEVRINQIVDFFASIGAPHLRRGNAVKLYGSGYTTIESIIEADEFDLVTIVGENGRKIYAGLRRALTDIPSWKLMGSTNFFGRGVGTRKMKKLIQALGYPAIYRANVAQIAAVDTFEDKTAQKVVDGMAAFMGWMAPLMTEGLITIDPDDKIKGGILSGKKVVFTGFRDKGLQQRVESSGGTMQSAVSGKTDIVVTTDPNSNSGKIKKARTLGKTIISVDDFKQML